MRHHDIERLKEAARRYAANKYTVGDMEELSEFACNALFEPPCSEKIRKVDNGDGTETWYGLPVVVPVGLVPDGETPVEVRSRALRIKGPFISDRGQVEIDAAESLAFIGDLRIVLANKPEPVTWTPPASMGDGEWRWSGSAICHEASRYGFDKSMRDVAFGADWTDPPKPGRYRKEGRVATWIGD